MRPQHGPAITNAVAPQPPVNATVQPPPATRATTKTTSPHATASASRRPACPRRSVFTGGASHLTLLAASALVAMMELVSVPPFERFYEEQKGPVLAQLRRRLGKDVADDAFQETFLRALRASPALEHGRHLRAWVLTIARNVATDFHRRERITSADVPHLAAPDEPLPPAEPRRPPACPPPH